MKRSHGFRLPSSRSEAEIPIYRDVFRHSLFRPPFFSPAPMLPFSHALLFILLLCAPAVVFSQQTWERTYGGTGRDQGYSVQQTSDSGYIIVGETYSFGAGVDDVYLIKTNASGDTLWTKTYGGTNFDGGFSVQQTSDRGYIIAGFTYSFGAGGYDVWLIRTNANGDTLWTRTYGGTGNDAGWSVQQTSDSGYAIAGYTTSFGAGGYDVYLIKTNAQGDTLWSRTYGGADYDVGFSAQQTSDGGYIITGTTYSFGAGNGDVYLIKTNASGDTLWTKTYGGTNDDWGWSVRQTLDGGYIITGGTLSFGDSTQAYLIKTNASGDTIWTRTYGGINWDEGYSVRQTSDSGYIITGVTYSFGAGHDDVYLIKTNATGDTLWTKTYGGINSDEGYSVQQTLDRGYIITGYTSFGAGGFDVYLIKTDATGNVGVEENSPGRIKPLTSNLSFSVVPNPFTSFASVPGHSSERFALYDISGRQVGVYKGDRIGAGLSAGVYFLRPFGGYTKPIRIVKLR